MAQLINCLVTSGFLTVVIGSAAALAQSCGEDLRKLAQKREAAMQTINAMVAAANGWPLDSAILCARSAPLISAENSLLVYMEKNKDLCQVADEAIAELKTTHAKTIARSSKACKVAAEQKKIKERLHDPLRKQILDPLPVSHQG
jgi:hypothetical protein